MSLFFVMITLTLFSSIFISLNQWLSYQRKSAFQIYQSLQATSIVANQKYRQLAKLNCQSKVEQNGIIFQIYCEQDKVKVVYPTGEMSL